MTRTILRTATIALATAALAAPTALARPDAAAPTAPAHHLAGLRPAANHFVTRPVLDRNPAPANAPTSRPVTVSVAPADRGIDWTTIAIGIAGSLLAVGAIAAIAGHTRRTRHPRIAA
jgi:hypothetical protein